MTLLDSFSPGDTESASKGQLAHPMNIAHLKQLEEHLYQVGEKAYCFVGNGLSNQTFVEGPEGLIVVDTGESIQEMEAALRAVRKVTKAPVVACFYSHFHYVSGTQALLDEGNVTEIPIYGHSGIPDNIARFGGEVAPRVSRGLVHQFGLKLPSEGKDGLVHVGLGRFFRNPAHAPFTQGYIPPNITFNSRKKFKVAGLDVEFVPAPSDATDSLTIWFPSLKVAINNLLWPALFNIFAIRGEEYRDPRVLLDGLDELRNYVPEFLIGAHGPPLFGAEPIAKAILKYRDSIQYIWDQTVRGANLGLSADELIKFVSLPTSYKDTYLTQQLYGLVEHHVRQIYFGLFGWFDEDESKLFPVPAPERAKKLIAGFGGKEMVRAAFDQAMEEKDYRWAVELASWLVRYNADLTGKLDSGEREDRVRLSNALKAIAYSTTSSNIRNWCLTRALELDGTINLSRFREHRFVYHPADAGSANQTMHLLRVLLVPERAQDYEARVGLFLDGEKVSGLIIRNQVAVSMVLDGKNFEKGPELELKISKGNWAKLMSGRARLSQLIGKKEAECVPDNTSIIKFFSCFDHPSFCDSEEEHVHG